MIMGIVLTVYYILFVITSLIIVYASVNLFIWLYRGFVGGPNLIRKNTLHFMVGNKRLSVTVPYDKISRKKRPKKPPKEVNFPYQLPKWFDDNKEKHGWHHYAPVNTESWTYSPMASLMSNTYGTLDFQIRIKRLPSSVRFSAQDRQALADFLVNDYYKFHNGEVNEETGAGTNTRIRQELKEEAENERFPWSESKFTYMLGGRMKREGKLFLKSEIVTFDSKTGTDWVLYKEMKANSFSRTDCYCLPLDKRYFLELYFNHKVNQNRKRWRKNADATQKRIIQSIVISDDNASYITRC